jgi:hypothetical protein
MCIDAYIGVVVYDYTKRCYGRDASLSTVLSAFVDEFAGVTAALVEPELLLGTLFYRIYSALYCALMYCVCCIGGPGCCEIWQGLLEIDSLRRVVLSSPSSLQAAMHILKSSLTFENPELETISEDMCADIAPSSAEIVAVTDVALRELTGTPVKFQDIYGSGASSSSSSSRDEDGGRVEATASLGTCLTRAADLCIVSIMSWTSTICIYVCRYIYIYIYIYIYMCTYAYVFICMCICVYDYEDSSVHACLFV